MNAANGRAPGDRLRQAAEARGFPADDRSLETIVAYLRALLDANRAVNLTAARDLDSAVDVLAITALAVVRAWPAGRTPQLVVDLGSGNGFPGVAAAVAWPAASVLLLERRRKKADAIGACLRAAGLSNAAALPHDVRDLPRIRPEARGGVDLVTVRAAGSLAETTAMAAPLLAPEGRVAHWKGRRLTDAEREAGRAAAGRAGLAALPELAFEDAFGPARIVVYERSRLSPRG